MSKYTDYNFQPFLQSAIEKLGFTEPTPIQKEIIPLVLKGKSAIGQAHTGTGKTHSFLIPIVEKIDVERQELQAIITSPTRELATQIFKELGKLIAKSGNVLVYGAEKEYTSLSTFTNEKVLLKNL